MAAWSVLSSNCKGKRASVCKVEEAGREGHDRGQNVGCFSDSLDFVVEGYFSLGIFVKGLQEQLCSRLGVVLGL